MLLQEGITETQFRVSFFQAAYRVAKFKNSTVFDSGLYLHEETKQQLTFQPLSIGV